MQMGKRQGTGACIPHVAKGLHAVGRGPILVRTRPERGEGGVPPPPLQTPTWLYRLFGFVGAGDFVLGIRQVEIFLFDLMCLYSKYSEFCGEFKNG